MAAEVPESLVRWARQKVRSIDDDHALLKLMTGAEIIALGEPGHGAHEPLVWRNRLVRLLLEHERIGAIAIESGILESRPLDQWTHTGEGEVDRLAARHLSWGFGGFAANVDLLRLLAAHNRSHATKVRFFGFDISGGDGKGEVSAAAQAPRLVVTWLRARGGLGAVSLADELVGLADRLDRATVRAMDASDREVVRNLLDRVDNEVDTLAGAGVDQDMATQTRWTRVALRTTRSVFEMFCRWPDVSAGSASLPEDAVAAMLEASGYRDEAMADNVEWIFDEVGRRPVLVFAANGHVIAGRHSGGLWTGNSALGLPAGYHLRRRRGDRYRVLLTSSASSHLVPPPEGTPFAIDRWLAATGHDRFVLDLRQAPPEDHWLDAPQQIGTNGPYPQAFVPRLGSDAVVYFATLTPALAAPLDRPPATDVEPTIDLYAGQEVTDPYRWLEGDPRSDPRVADWVDRQMRFTAAHLDRIPNRESLRSDLRAVWNFEKVSCPIRRGDRYFHETNSGLQRHAVTVVQAGLEGSPRTLLDPNAMDPNDGDVVRDWQPTHDGECVAYTVQHHGGDWRRLRFRSVESGRDLPDELSGLKSGQFAWQPDGAAVYYSRFEQTPSDPVGTLTAHCIVCLHRMGTPQLADVIVFDGRADGALLQMPYVTEDGRWLVITSSNAGGTRCKVRVQDLSGGVLTPLVTGLTDRWLYLGAVGRHLLFLTDSGAPFGAIVKLDPTAGEAQVPLTCIPQGEHAIRGAVLAGDEIVVRTQVGVDSAMHRYTSADGRWIAAIDVPPFCVVEQIRGQISSPELFYRVSSMARAPEVWRLDLSSSATSVFRAPVVSWVPDDFIIRQIVATSADGTRIPVTFVHRRDLDSSIPWPTALMVYGGFGLSPDLGFMESRFGWLNMGGAFAVAHTRGGAEFGSAWASAARKSGRQLVVADYLAAADALCEAGICTTRTLVAIGASNGGMIVAAAVNARPEAFSVALCRVPMLDLLRYTRFTMGKLWIDELGDPDSSDDLPSLLAFSPLHNVRPAVYPAMMVTTADRDDRVMPSNSFKFIATLQSSQLGPGPFLLRVEKDAGHGEGKSSDQLIDEFTDLWAFAGAHIGMRITRH